MTAHQLPAYAPVPGAYGLLEVICGPMFSGKSTKLQKRLLVARDFYGRGVLCLKPAFDTRYGESRVVSHDGKGIEACAIASWPDIPGDIRSVFVDEVQFLAAPLFSGDAVAGIKDLLSRGIDVTACGLDCDWKGDPFHVTASLAAMADKLDKRTARCTVCNSPATKTFKKVPNAELVELGEKELYEARCNGHWRRY